MYTFPQHSDEAQYVWSAQYFGRKVAHFDFRRRGTDTWNDPGWSPWAWWALTQPMGTRLLYALAIPLFDPDIPELPCVRKGEMGPERWLARETLLLFRTYSLICASVGLALLTARLGWRGIAVALPLLLTPEVGRNFAGAHAEGPLMLGFGLCAIAYGTAWFAPLCGVAATFKLTGLGVWPLAFLGHPIGKSRVANVLSVAVSALVWVVLTPPSWFAGGPTYLGVMILHRLREYQQQYSGRLSLPVRYLWPLELAALVAIAVLAPRLITMSRRSRAGARLEG